MKPARHTLLLLVAVLFAAVLAPLLAGAQAITFTNDTFIAATDLEFEGFDIVVTQCTVTIEGSHTFNNVQVLSGGVLAHPNDLAPTGFAGGLMLTVTNELVIDAGGMIRADGLGYGPGSGPGAGATALTNFPYAYFAGSGAGNGGYGGSSSSRAPGGGAYGVANAPLDAGSGGGAGTDPGGAGGGAVRLIVAGGLRLDGQVSANGANGVQAHSGGGSGGSVWISAATISGSGSITANGGAGEPTDGGGGGGGRIALEFVTNTLAGPVAAKGGLGSVAGGAGTIWQRSHEAIAGLLLLDNGGPRGTNTPLADLDSAIYLEVRGGAVGQAGSVTGLVGLVVRSNSWLVPLPNLTPLDITITGDAAFEAGGGILADGAGYPGTSGSGAPGAGRSVFASALGGYIGGGGGHGGYGGSSVSNSTGGLTYDSFNVPLQPGSGGGYGSAQLNNGFGGSGGGVIRLAVSGSLALEGKVSADGVATPAGSAGGGAGGTIRMTINQLAGAGTITANGGAGALPFGGGGAGGRISIVATNSTFAGSVLAHGAAGAQAGGAGTVFTQLRGFDSATVTMDNGGLRGTNTPLPESSLVNLYISGGAIANVGNLSSLTLRQLWVRSNSTFLAGKSTTPLSVSVLSNATVEAGGNISLDGTIITGPGQGRSGLVFWIPGVLGSGAGHAGYGGTAGGSILGGIPYGTLSMPAGAGISTGSSGGAGNGTAPNNRGGLGGGGLDLNVFGTLSVEGAITANGSAGIGQWSGGGSGGGLLLHAGKLVGSGRISADGGAADPPYGGGGSGGRIAVYCNTNNFAGVVSAHGGSGAMAGAAGTIYTRVATVVAPPIPSVVLDNGGLPGTNTPVALAETADLTITGGAQMQLTLTGAVVRNLLIGSNSWLSGAQPFGRKTLTVTNAVIQAGGGITMDGQGTYQGPGTGGSANITGGGGGYGGYGGRSSSNGSGGFSFGSVTAPIDLGCGGGFGTGGSPSAGIGGGALTFNVSGMLQLDGSISANGQNAPGQNGGGGSGGSLWLTVGSFSGAGLIAANGGSGDIPAGGGGGGGRISISYASNTFAGSIIARGGPGATYGGAGTVYLTKTKENLSGPLVRVDNGGVRGANTGLPLVNEVELAISGGAQVVTTNVTLLNALFIATNSWLTYTSPYVTRFLTIRSNATIQAGGGLVLDGQGFNIGSGLGAGMTVNGNGSGGGHGGYGGRSATNALGGNAYGSITLPTELGSGGGLGTGIQILPPNSGYGGGSLRLAVGGTLIVDGRLSADGITGYGQNAGGGSGGSLLLSASRLAGSGLISASGGNGDFPNGGGGGGGRVAVSYSSNLFTGAITARGGTGYGNGGAGTVFLRASNQLSTVVLDNGGAPGTNTPLNGGLFDNLTIGGGAFAVLSEPPRLSNLMIKSNGWLAFGPSFISTALFTVTGDATIEAGGGILMDARGNPGSRGLGFGGSVQVPGLGVVGGGGGYGGYGGSGAFGAAGGVAYDTLTMTQPNAGSGGGPGGGSSTNAAGGAGGGTLSLIVSRTLALDGRISANGQPGIGQWSGGGSGGGINLNVQTLTGSGVLSANGGAGDPPYGGGGGGGRIAISYVTNKFQGTISARGGAGANNGGAGTQYRKQLGALIGEVTMDNGGAMGTNTPLSVTSNLDVIVRGGAKANPTGPAAWNKLTIGSDSWINTLPLSVAGTTGSALSLTLIGPARVEAGGGITLAGAGPTGGNGAGGTFNIPGYGLTGGGGGHGGLGGGSPGLNQTLGAAYDSILQPTNQGSGGGGSPYFVTNVARGGGAIRIVVSNSLTLNGVISADGADATRERYGGGSGGSVWITANRLEGTGTISADGGGGDFEFSGGGAGGRVAVYVANSLFTGQTHALGGLGAKVGGAGTFFLRESTNAVGKLAVDNGGWFGESTPLSAPEAFDLSVSGGAKAQPDALGGALTLGNLTMNNSGSFTHTYSQSNLDLIVFGNLNVSADSSIDANGQGFAGTNAGPGVGQMPAGNSGSGAGYGGAGGASASGIPGGVTYGSALTPTDRGSRGGLNATVATNQTFSPGGGALRLRVGGNLALAGRVTANGADAVFDGGGGGSGGSVWINAGTLSGAGFITANGGSGEPFDGGGGGGGRIAIYTRTNVLSGPVVAGGGFGANFGGNGTVVKTNIAAPVVQGQNPDDVVMYAVSHVDVAFGSLMNSNSLSVSDIFLDTPNGPLPSGSLSVILLDLQTARISFPPQIAFGYYELHLGPVVQDIYGLPMSAMYVGSFVILPPLISGRVTDVVGTPIRFVSVQPTGGLPSAVTDINGNYSLEVLPSWNGTLTPVKSGLSFMPASRTYNSLTNDMANQNFVVITPALLTMNQQLQGTNLQLGWYGVEGVSYQTWTSSDLVNWVPYQGPVYGSNAIVQVLIPVVAAPAGFFRFSTLNLGPGFGPAAIERQ